MEDGRQRIGCVKGDRLRSPNVWTLIILAFFLSVMRKGEDISVFGIHMGQIGVLKDFFFSKLKQNHVITCQYAVNRKKLFSMQFSLW